MKTCSKCGVQNSIYLTEDKFVEIDGKIYCPYCAKQLLEKDHDEEEEKTVPNKIVKKVHTKEQTFKKGDVFKILGYFIAATGTTLSILIFVDRIMLGLLSFMGFIICGIIIIGIGEIINSHNDLLIFGKEKQEKRYERRDVEVR